MKYKFILGCLISTTFIIDNPSIAGNNSVELPKAEPPKNDFFLPVNNFLKDLENQGVTVTSPSEPMSVRYNVGSPCSSCSLYLGTGVANPRKDGTNGTGFNFGLGFTMPLSH